jgi:hypothetical protein
MREIKFRAWDKVNKCWYKTELEFYGFALFGECTLMCPPRVSDLKNLEITQFTGLKDKNGKEIYEGDILKIKELPPQEVFWVNELAQYRLLPFDCRNEWDKGRTIEFAKIGIVIGNIYENPELLKE